MMPGAASHIALTGGWFARKSPPYTVSSKCSQGESPSPFVLTAPLMPPCAHTEWERLTGTARTDRRYARFGRFDCRHQAGKTAAYYDNFILLPFTSYTSCQEVALNCGFNERSKVARINNADTMTNTPIQI